MVVRLAQSDSQMFPFLYINQNTGQYEGIFHEVWKVRPPLRLFYTSSLDVR